MRLHPSFDVAVPPCIPSWCAPPRTSPAWLVPDTTHDIPATGASRRLRRSIEELQSDPADTGVLNHIPFVNRLIGWWAWMRDAGWLKTATKEQRAALKRDLQPIVEIAKEL